MNIKLYKNLSEVNKLEKTIQEIRKLTGTLKTSTSIVDPKIIIEISISDIIRNVNYMYIQEFDRYYFIKNITSVRNGLWEFECHVDVLMTYKAQIKNHRAVIKRQENKWNLYLDDGIFKTYQNPSIITKAFPSGFTSQNFILAIAGG